jgi:GR25 family glycosyltransferase involved in LPS biosynthesis
VSKVLFDWCYLSFNSLGGLATYEGPDIKKIFFKVIYTGYGTHAYILSKKGCKKILKYYEQEKIYHPLDSMDKIKSDYKNIFKLPFNIISVKPDFNYYNTLNKNNFVYNNGKEFPFYVNDFADSDTTKIV